MVKDGINPALTKIEEMVLPVGNTYQEIMNWSMKPEAKYEKNPKVAITQTGKFQLQSGDDFYMAGKDTLRALQRDTLDGSGFKTRKRQQRDIIEQAVGGFGAGISSGNVLSIAEIREEIEGVNGQLRAAVKDIHQDAETATDLRQQVNQLVGKELKQLQPYQSTINELIDRQSAISKELDRVQTCNMYATHLLQSLHANLLQLDAHRLPNWASNAEFKACIKTTHQAADQLRELTLVSSVPFDNDNHTVLLRTMLKIPRAEKSSTHERFQGNTLRDVGNGMLIKLKDAPEHAIQRAARTYSIDIRICKGGGNNWLCPEKAISTEDYCGYITYENCTLAIEVNNQTMFNSVQYLVNYYTVMSYNNYIKGSIVFELPGHDGVLTSLSEYITIGCHELIPHRNVSTVEGDDLERMDDD
ncbi:hypothetical protein scyTo_0000162 [Scyliorhinus torazame]|uniref:Uncharacterized protein n=1 Tax=Scyliorhinus torazame TaxID=75743 RepID=A0A401NRM0_SCYTO|nr:hypothetical protein [Scyliorhinus torazame]